MSASELRERWIARRDEWKRLDVHVNGAQLAQEVIADLESLSNGDDETLTYAQAAALSRYSVDHIGRLVRDGKLRDVGRKGAPRVLASELPRKPALQLAGTATTSYDPASDARSLRRSAVRSNHGS